MKYKIQLRNFLFIVVLFILYVIFPIEGYARIDERRESIERRLFGSGGIVYRDDVIEASRRRGMPYLQYLHYMPDSAEIRIYFKTSDGRRPTSSELEERRISNGWDLHVIYLEGKSAIELYKRSQGITEFEINHLLALHSEGAYWKRTTKEEKEETLSAFGYEMIRSDGRVRAKKIGGDKLMFIQSKLDELLAEMNMIELQQSAPVSVDGF